MDETCALLGGQGAVYLSGVHLRHIAVRHIVIVIVIVLCLIPPFPCLRFHCSNLTSLSSSVFASFLSFCSPFFCFVLIINQVAALISQIYCWNKTLHVSDSSSVHHQEFFTVHTANLYDVYHCCVYSGKLLMMDRGTVRNMYRFYSKINFKKLVHLVWFYYKNLSRCTFT